MCIHASKTFKPDTYNDPFFFVLFNVVVPDIFNSELIVVSLLKLVKLLTWNEDYNVVLLLKY